MEQENTFSRYNILWMIILCYLLPLIGISTYGTLFPRDSADWNILSLGLLLTALGALTFFWIITQWEFSLNLPHKSLSANQGTNIYPDLIHENRPTINPEDYDLAKRSLVEAQQTQISLLSEIELLTEEIQKISLIKAETFQVSENLQKELESAKRSARKQLEFQQNHIRELQEAVAEQKAVSEKKQQQVLQLETKVGSLTNEIKTLLQFAEGHSSSLLSNESSDDIPFSETPSVAEKIETYSTTPFYSESSTQSAQEASQQLKHCLDIAQKIKGSQRFGSQIYTFLDSPADSFSIDLRRLCDRLRSETQSVILLYSPKDNHLLFASNGIKTMTGWSPEKFVQNFPEILLQESEWQQGVDSLAVRSEAQIQFQIRSKPGADLSINAVLGMIPTGIFRNHTIAILY